MRFAPGTTGKVFVYHNGELIAESFPVNEVENRKTHRQRTGPETADEPPTGMNYLDLLKERGDEHV